MKRRKLIRAAAAAGAATWPLTFGTGVAHAGAGDNKQASISWDFMAFPRVTCTLEGFAQLREFDGVARIRVNDDDPACQPFGLLVVIRYTDPFGNPSEAQAAAFDPSLDTVLAARAVDVEDDMVVDVTAQFDPDGFLVTSRTLRPK